MPRPQNIILALKDIIKADPNAIVASRIFDTMAFEPVPTCAEISDVGYLLSLGFKSFMLGDAVCLRRDSLIETLNLIKILVRDQDNSH